ncbi:MAG: asparaginase [Rhodocyclaceae bacterium]|nr:asparaginase [Rhodocyclaceae bacterium]
MTTRPRILLIATGGTITGVAADRSRPSHYRAGRLAADALLAAVPELAGVADVTVRQPFSLDSCEMGPDHWLQITREVAAGMADNDITGVVVTHGTDTLEESAFFVDRLIEPCKPIVMTCAMRPANALSADGPSNLMRAFEAASTAALASLGTVVVANERIHAAAWLRKGDTLALDAFDRGGSCVGRCGPVEIDTRPRLPARAPGLLAGLARLPRVDVLWIGAGSSADLLSACLERGARGLVLALPGNGTLPAAWRSAAADAIARGVPVVRASRTGGGAVGAATDDTAMLFAAGRLGPPQARVALMLAIAAGLPARHFFD